MPNTTVLAVIADTHIGSTTALCSPTYKVHTARPKETSETASTKDQQWIYKCWVDYWTYVSKLLEYDGNRRKNRLVVALLGDIIDNDHHGTNQIMPEINDQVYEAKVLLRPIIESADYSIGILGTEAHAGQAGGIEWGLYKDLGCDEIGAHVNYQIDGLWHNFAHHGKKNTVTICKEVLLACLKANHPNPSYVWRAHLHAIYCTGHSLANIRAIGCPCWQLPTGYAAKFEDTPDIGGMICVGGVLDWSRSRYQGQPDR